MGNDIRRNWLDFNQFREVYEKVEVKEYPNNVIEKIPDPEVSILLVTYNHKDYIRDAIESVLAQKVDFQYEIILGDDDSDDGTREICMEYAKKYPNLIRLQQHRRENNIKVLGKPCLIFQFGYNIYQSRGKYVAFLSGDDYWIDDKKLQKQVSKLNSNKNISYVYHPYIISKNDVLIDKVNKYWICTTLCVNNFYKLPKQFFNVRTEDVFIGYLLKYFGDGYNFESLIGAVYRQHDGNNWVHEDLIEKAQSRTLTAINLLNTFHGTKFEKELKNRLSKKIIREWVLKNERSELFIVFDYKIVIEFFKYCIFRNVANMIMRGLIYKLRIKFFVKFSVLKKTYFMK